MTEELHPERLRFRRTPLAAAAIWFALGILLAHLHTHHPLQVVVSLAGCGVLAAVSLRYAPRVAWFPVAALWMTMGIAAADWQPPTPSQTALLSYADNLSRTVRGRVLRVHPPRPQPENADADSAPAWEASEDTSHQRGQPVAVDLAVDEVEEVTPDVSTMARINGGVRIAVYEAGPAFDLRCGDRLEMPLRLKPPGTFRTPGAFDYSAYLLQQGIAVNANVSADHVVRLGSSPPTIRCSMYAAQAWAATRLVDFTESAVNLRIPSPLRLSLADAAMLNAMLFGDRSGLTHALRTGFERTGTFHLFVVSGLHIALVATGLYWFMRRVRIPVWLATVGTLAGTTAYAALTGMGEPSQRALWMTAIYLVTRLLSRDGDRMNALGAAILGLLVAAPSSLFDASFQMTMLVILAIAGIAVPLVRYTPARNVRLMSLVFVRPRRAFKPSEGQLLLMLELWGETIAGVAGKRGRWLRSIPARILQLLLRILELTLISFVAELVMVLPMAFYFHRLPIFSVPANLLILPAIGLLLPAAILTFAGSLLNPWCAAIPAMATAALLHAVRWIIHLLTNLSSADVRIPGPAWWLIPPAVGGWIACVWLVRRGRLPALAAALALPLIAAAILWPEPTERMPGTLELTALDVGQGDSLLAVNPDGETMLIDAGGPIGSHGLAETVAAFDVGEQVVAPYLWQRRIRRLDILVLSHAHTDHMGGMPAILDDLRPRELWVGIDPVSPLYSALLAKAASLHIVVRHLHAGERRPWGPVVVDVLAPAATYANLSAPRNDDSLVLHLQFGRASVLLEGDAERPSEDAMLAAGLVTPVTLLKVGHHGSKTSSNPEFLAAAQPAYAIISVGRNNSFGHPRAEVIQRLADMHTRVFRTDEFGLTTLLLTPDGAVSERFVSERLVSR